MRMFFSSATRQPCSWFSCMALIRNLPSGLQAQATWLPAQASLAGFCASMRAYHSQTPP